MNQKTSPTPAPKISPNTAVGLGIAAGFAFLLGLGAALRVLPDDFALAAGFALAIFAAVSLLLGRK